MKSRPIERTGSARLVEWLYEEEERLGLIVGDYMDEPSSVAGVHAGLKLLAEIAKGLGRVEVAIDMLAEDIRLGQDRGDTHGSADD